MSTHYTSVHRLKYELLIIILIDYAGYISTLGRAAVSRISEEIGITCSQTCPHINCSNRSVRQEDNAAIFLH
jgi:hypothetical protein